jgi:hypothetical protein
VGGFVLPGSRVDVICTTRGADTTSKVILQNLRVLAVDQLVKEKAEQPGPTVSTVTLAARPEEATRLALASNLGDLRLALRAQGDDKAVAPIVTRKEDLDSVRGSTMARPVPAEEGRAARVQEARDEVELLEAALEAKMALVTIEKKTLEESERRLKRLDQARSASRLSVNEDDYHAAALRVETGKAQVALREAELKEPRVRLAQAKRRLAALQPAAPRPPVKPPAATEERLRELERQLDALRKEVEELRRAARPGKGSGGDARP